MHWEMHNRILIGDERFECRSRLNIKQNKVALKELCVICEVISGR